MAAVVTQHQLLLKGGECQADEGDMNEISTRVRSGTVSPGNSDGALVAETLAACTPSHVRV
jgi:hypothetical protein